MRDGHFNHIWVNGHFVALRTYKNSCSFLYCVDKDLVELIYDRAKGKILSVAFADHHDLEKYLDQIELNELLKPGIPE